MAAMAVIFDPQGPLSLPCENTTMPTQVTPVCCRYRRMALDEEQSSASHELRRAIDCLRDSADLAEVDAASLEVLAAGAVHFSLPAGNVLFESGSTPDGVYLVASGRLGVKTSGMARLTAEIGRNAIPCATHWRSAWLPVRAKSSAPGCRPIRVPPGSAARPANGSD